MDAGNVGAGKCLRVRVHDAGDGKGNAIRLLAGLGNNSAQGCDEFAEVVLRRRASGERRNVRHGVGDTAFDGGAPDVEGNDHKYWPAGNVLRLLAPFAGLCKTNP